MTEEKLTVELTEADINVIRNGLGLLLSGYSATTTMSKLARSQYRDMGKKADKWWEKLEKQKKQKDSGLQGS
jgi:hypothetical protein